MPNDHFADATDLGEDAAITSGERTLRLQAVAGIVYHIALDFDQTTPDEFQFTLQAAPAAPVNDAFARRIDLGAVASAEAVGSTAGATRQFGEPSHARDQAQTGSIWWSWTAPQDMPVEIDAGSSEFNSNVAVYTGSKLLSLDEIASNEARGAAFFLASAGQT